MKPYQDADSLSGIVPESPRYLVQRGDHKEALNILVRLHRDPNDLNNTFAREELRMIEDRWEKEKDIVKTDGSWRLFTKKANRDRLLLAWLVMVGGQNIGPLVINNYNVLLYGSLGLGPTNSLLLSAVYNTVGLVIACIGGVIADRLGRRKSMGTTSPPPLEHTSFYKSDGARINLEYSDRVCLNNVCFRNLNRHDCKIQHHSIKGVGCGCYGVYLYLRGLVKHSEFQMFKKRYMLTIFSQL
jgi:hypothetical protein